MSQKPSSLSPQIQKQIGMLNLRIEDMMTQFNTVMKTVLEENTALQQKILELQVPVKTKTPEK